MGGSPACTEAVGDKVDDILKQLANPGGGQPGRQPSAAQSRRNPLTPLDLDLGGYPGAGQATDLSGSG